MRRLVVLGLLMAMPARAEDDDFPKLRFRAFLDVRGVATDDETSWLDGGLGKTRYGGEDGDARVLGRVGQASMLFTAAFTDELSARVQANVDADPDPLFRDAWNERFHLVEYMVAYRPVLSPRVRLTSRAGLLFPFSIENTGLGWSSVYGLTANAANSWIGEEVRPTAAEVGIMLMPEGHEVSLAAAAFVGNDTAGTLLCWRGWALHDRQSGLYDQVPLPPIRSLEPGGVFAKNAPWVEPVREIDGRVGYWASAGWVWSGKLEARAFYYDNRGDPLRFDGTQYAWDTRFGNLAVIVDLPGDTELFLQHMAGNTVMGPGAADVDFATTSAMISSAFGRHRVTARYEIFETEDLDFFQIQDDNDEEGWSAMAAYLVDTGKKHQVVLEALYVDSDRPVRVELGRDPEAQELQLQAAFRIWY